MKLRITAAAVATFIAVSFATAEVKNKHHNEQLSALVATINAKLARWIHPTGKCGGAREVLATQYGNGDGTAGGPVACRGYGRFDPNKLTVATRNHPCGTKIHLVNPHNGQSVDVVRTDYGPATHAEIDVSAGAARELGMKGRLMSSSYLCMTETVRADN